MTVSHPTTAPGEATTAPQVVVSHFMRQQGFDECGELGLLPGQFGEWGLAFGPYLKTAFETAAKAVDDRSSQRGAAIERIHQIRVRVMSHASNFKAAQVDLRAMGIALIDPETGVSAKRDVVTQILTAALALLVGAFDLVEVVRAHGVYRA